MKENYKPSGYNVVTAYLVVKNAEAVIEFAEKVFDAVVVERMEDHGKIMHAEFKIGDTIIMIGNGNENSKLFPGMLYVYVEDTDETYQKAINAGAKSIMEPQDKFYGDRNAAVEDCCGNQWWIATHRVTLTKEQLKERMEETTQ